MMISKLVVYSTYRMSPLWSLVAELVCFRGLLLQVDLRILY